MVFLLDRGRDGGFAGDVSDVLPQCVQRESGRHREIYHRSLVHLSQALWMCSPPALHSAVTEHSGPAGRTYRISADTESCDDPVRDSKRVVFRDP